MEIRKLDGKDIAEVVELWYETSVQAHDFIAPDYWKENKEAMAKEYLPESETYLALDKNKIAGFIAMADNYLAAIFVQANMQGSGIGKKLLNYIKEKRATIQLKVYKKNANSVNFYKRQDFKILSENIEKRTSETELLMEWNK